MIREATIETLLQIGGKNYWYCMNWILRICGLFGKIIEDASPKGTFTQTATFRPNGLFSQVPIHHSIFLALYNAILRGINPGKLNRDESCND